MREFYQHKIISVLNISKLVTIHYFEFPPYYKYKGESHDFWELVYCDNNEVIITQNDTDILLQSGELLIHRPNVFHKISSNGKTCSVFIISFVSTSKSLNYLSDDNEKLKLDMTNKNLISEIIAEADKTFDVPAFHTKNKKLELLSSPVFGGMQMIKLYLEMLLINLLRSEKHISRLPERAMSVQAETDVSIVNSIKDFLSKNIYNSVTLAEISHELNYGKTFLCMKFKQSTGLSIYKYFTQMKIKEAKKLIRENKYTFAQMSDMLNFCSPSHFAYVFKKETKSSLTQYKNSIKN